MARCHKRWLGSTSSVLAKHYTGGLNTRRFFTTKRGRSDRSPLNPFTVHVGDFSPDIRLECPLKHRRPTQIALVARGPVVLYTGGFGGRACHSRCPRG